MPIPSSGERWTDDEIAERLGAGGVGFVYRAKHAKLDRLVAIKVLQQFAAADPEWRRRFAREAKALSALASPNIVTVTGKRRRRSHTLGESWPV